MKSLLAFTKKEITAQLRSTKLIILIALFVFFGVLSPVTAKITPWLLEAMSEALEQGGITTAPTTATVLDSWMQFFKNMSMCAIAFALIEGNIFTGEYGSGTLILSLTKGLPRHKVVIAKTAILAAVWTVVYWLCFAVTYFCNMIWWDNSVVPSLGLAVVCWWVFGLFVVALITLFSTLFRSFIGALGFTGIVVLVFSLISIAPIVANYLPTYLMTGTALIYSTAQPSDFLPSIIITIAASIVCFAVSIPLFNKKQL